MRKSIFLVTLTLALTTACEDESKIKKENITPVITIEASELNCNKNLDEVMEKLDDVSIESFIDDCEKYKKNKKVMNFRPSTEKNTISEY